MMVEWGFELLSEVEAETEEEALGLIRKFLKGVSESKNLRDYIALWDK